MERPLRPLEELGRAVARAQDEQLEGTVGRDLAKARERLLEGTPAKRTSAKRWPLLLAAAAVLALASVLVVVGRQRPLDFHVGTQPGEVGGWIAPADGRVLVVGFSDGTSLAVDPDSRARVIEVTSRGARLVLERGRVQASVIHKPGARWSVVAGPFEVRVTGTRFELSWDPQREALSLALLEGSVLVSGAPLGVERPVVAGETLRVDVKEKRVELSLAGASPPVPLVATATVVPTVTTAVEPPPAPALSHPPASAPSPAVSTPPNAAWRTLAAEGKYKEALAAAETSGFSTLADQAGAADLLLLGDVARYAGSADRAGEAWLALRRRFPGDARAATAAFSLGRLAFDQKKSFGDAAKWFSTYLGEQPGGSFAREAAGRLIEARKASGDLAGARTAAKQYLAKYPDGPHATLAKSMADE